jgi:hypothetical protein
MRLHPLAAHASIMPAILRITPARRGAVTGSGGLWEHLLSSRGLLSVRASQNEQPHSDWCDQPQLQELKYCVPSLLEGYPGHSRNFLKHERTIGLGEHP